MARTTRRPRAATTTRRKKTTTRRKTAATPASKTRETTVIATWEDDPGDPTQTSPATVTAPVPNLSAQPLPSRIAGTAPPASLYPTGSAPFRYYAAAAALRRTADFWGTVVDGPITWQVGKVLPVVLDDGVDLNAFYTRGGFGDGPGLHFFHQAVSGRTYFSGESPDVVCHEMGHAVLDALRPQLFDAQTIEAAAFHESFGDMSAILSALQVESFRQEVLSETSGVLNRSSRLSRLAEQLGAAIRMQHPDAVDSDCLRNAANSFFYKDPQTLPPSAPANQLSSEPHSFSRVFTAAFLDVLAAMFTSASAAASPDDLATTATDAARLLVRSVVAAPVVPDYYSQIAAHMIDAGEEAPFNGKYREVLKAAFVRRGILSLHGAATVAAPRPRTRRPVATFAQTAPSAELPMAQISASQYGLAEMTLKVFTPEEPKRFAVTSSSLQLGPVEPRSPQNAAESFTEDLFQRGRVDVGDHGHPQAGFMHPYTTKTHVVVRESGSLVLRRRTFDCGFD
jgi:hypothetical protein